MYARIAVLIPIYPIDATSPREAASRSNQINCGERIEHGSLSKQ
jgi:hypothetical protein